MRDYSGRFFTRNPVVRLAHSFGYATGEMAASAASYAVRARRSYEDDEDDFRVADRTSTD